MKIMYPEVNIEPPSVGVLTSSGIPRNMSLVVPSVRRQTTSPVPRSIAAIIPHGGGVHGRLYDENTTPRRTPNGAPAVLTTYWS